MEQFVLGIFQEQLSKFIVGFRKEQVNANLLNGKGEITDVSLNCPELNKILATLTPYVELESVHVSKLSFHVTAWANLRKAPILIDIQHVRAVTVEPLHHLDINKRRRLQQLTQAQLTELIQRGLHKLRGAYHLFDRILDNLTIEMRSLHISFQPRGKFKTRRVGPWTPPTIHVNLQHIRYVSVNEFGDEASPEEVWRHNKHPHGQPAHLRTLQIYKRLSMRCTVGLSAPGESVQNDDNGDSNLLVLMREAQLEAHVCLHKRLRDAAILAVQADATIEKVECHIPPEAVSMLAHVAAGMKYCFAKNRAYEDPLVIGSFGSMDEVEVSVDDLEPSNIVIDEEPVEDLEGPDEDEAEDQDMEAENELKATTSSVDDNASDLSSVNDDDGDTTSIDDSMHSKPTVSTKQSFYGGDRPLILMPNGLVIHEHLTLTLSVHHCTIRGIYPEKLDGYVQLVLKGLIAELIWPKTGREKGGYAQASLSYVSLQERHGPRVRSILIGGIQNEPSRSPLEKPGNILPEIRSDENFPLFEDRCIRNDPLDLRHTFPAQAFGLKLTVSFIDKLSDPGKEEMLVLQEIGIDRFDMVMDAEAWCRAIRFASNEHGGGFDKRWNSGDWGDLLTTDMLLNPSRPLNLENHLQEAKEIFLDDNYMISSDLLNVTARITNVEIRVPAAIQKDVRSCDVVITLAEVMVVVSSALPRTFLTGKIGASIRGDERKHNVKIDFPNDPSDICYALEETEDPLIRQRGTMTSRTVSTFRVQLTVRAFSVRLIPVIPFGNAPQCQQLLEPSEMTLIACFEGEPPETIESNLTKIVLFLSVQVHRLGMNCDFDVITGAVSTILHHADTVEETRKAVNELFGPGLVADGTTVQDESLALSSINGKIRCSVSGRRVLVRRQLQRSRETGGLSVSICMQIAEIEFQLWRQNVSVFSRFRASLANCSVDEIDDTQIPLLKLVSVHMEGLEVGLEYLIHPQNRRIVVKGCLAEVVSQMCDFDAVSATAKRSPALCNGQAAEEESDVSGQQSPLYHDDEYMLECVSFGTKVEPNENDATISPRDIAMRAEEISDTSRAVTCVVDIGSTGVVHFHFYCLETVIFLIVEALLMPSGMKHATPTDSEDNQSQSGFKARSVGAVLFAMIPAKLFSFEQSAVEIIQAVDTMSTGTDLGDIDRTVLSLKDRLLPGVSNLLLMMRLKDTLVFLPDTSSQLFDERTSKWVGVRLRHSSLLTTYFDDVVLPPGAAMSVLVDRGKTWSELIQERKHGFRHVIQSHQSLHSAKPMKARGEITRTLVPEFEIQGSYHASEVHISMGNSPIQVSDLNEMRRVFNIATMMLHRSVAIQSKAHAILSTFLVGSCSADEKEMEDSAGEPTMPKIEMTGEVTSSIRAGRRSLSRLRQLLDGHDLELRDALLHKQREVDTLRYHVFMKERERLAALTLVSAQVSCWLRMGGTHLFGQRYPKLTSMWRYFAVLRKSLLILYPAPGDPKPVDIVLLHGARLHPLAGGRRKRDVRLGFSIVEGGGIVRFFLAANAAEYENWIRELQKAMNAPSIFPIDGKMAGNENDDGEPDAGRLRSMSFEGTNSIGAGSDEATPRKQKIRQRFSAITAGTKTRLGSAVQAARQKARPTQDTVEPSAALPTEIDFVDANEVASDDLGVRAVPSDIVDASTEANDAPDDKRNEIPTLLTHGDSQSEDTSLDTYDSRRAKMGQRFAAIRSGTKNKLGAAVQKAKEKGRAVNEQRRKRREERMEKGEMDLGSPDMLDATAATQSQNEDCFPDMLTAEIEPASVSTSQTNYQETEGLQQMPHTVPEPSVPPESSHYSDVDDMAPAGANEEDGTNPCTEDFGLGERIDSTGPTAIRKLQLRQRVSQLGSAVKSVRRGGPQRGQDEALGNSMQRSLPSNAYGAADVVKLKSLRMGVGHPADELGDRAIPLLDLPLRKIGGCWIVEVHPDVLEVNLDDAIPSETNGKIAPPKSSEPEMVKNDGRQQTADNRSTEMGQNLVENQDDSDAPAEFQSTPQVQLDQAFRIGLQDGKTFGSGAKQAEPGRLNEVVRSLADVLELHAIISDMFGEHLMQASIHQAEVDQVCFDSEESADRCPIRFEMSPLEIVRCAGRKLGGLLEVQRQEFRKPDSIIEYQCEVLAEFLHSLLDCPLPREARAAVTQFLNIAGDEPSYDQEVAKTNQPQFLSDTSWRYCEPESAVPARSKYTEAIKALSTVCDTELLRAELSQVENSQQHRAAAAAAAAPSSRAPTHQPYVEPLLPLATTATLHDAMHQALINVMVERDEAHAQLIAASVLHVHEMEQERKKVERMSHQLEQAEQLASSSGSAPPPFFAGNKNPSTSTAAASSARNVHAAAKESRLTAYEEQMMQNSEAELLSLCQQLASEISSRTSASLEIIRLKESRKIEREHDQKEKEALQDELRRCKEMLAASEQKLQAAGVGEDEING